MKNQVLEVLKRVNESIVDGVNLIEENIIDSFEVVNIVMELEEEFDIEIDAEEVVSENFETVDAITALVKKCQGN
ncbi:MAG: acyl carrier protein [Clostridia bacterium]|nr:acyl carrier protein [Clostridia bacterium]